MCETLFTMLKSVPSSPSQRNLMIWVFELFGVHTRPLSIVEMLQIPLAIPFFLENIFRVKTAALQDLAPVIPSVMFQR